MDPITEENPILVLCATESRAAYWLRACGIPLRHRHIVTSRRDLFGYPRSLRWTFVGGYPRPDTSWARWEAFAETLRELENMYPNRLDADTIYHELNP